MDIAEANAKYYTGPTKATDDAGKLADNFDSFLTILTTQLANQDPLSPTDSTEFTNQLVSFTQVEQSIATNKNLESLIQLQSIGQQNNEATILISYLGKTIGADVNVAKLENDQASWEMEFGAAADEVTYEVRDDRGNLIYTHVDDSGASKGSKTFTWDGTTDSGGQAPEGVYQLTTKATTDGGSNVDVAYNFKGVARSVETVNGAPALMVNGVPIGLGNIISVEIPETTDQSA